MRICSLLPAATEIAFALGLGDDVVGVSHECDYPAQAQEKPMVVRSAIDSASMTSAEINRRVADHLQAGKSPYSIDEDAFKKAAPDVILTQGLCEVCALDYHDVVRVAQSLLRDCAIVSLNPNSLTDVLDDILRVGAGTQRREEAQALVADMKRRIDRVRAAQSSYHPRVACFDWLDPLFVAGHWIPEMVAIAGGESGPIRKGEPSACVEWQRVLEFAPEVILLMPCGFDLKRTIEEGAALQRLNGWHELPAVKQGNVYAVDGNSYFSRPGPRLVDGLELLARIVRCENLSQGLPADAVMRLSATVRP